MTCKDCIHEKVCGYYAEFEEEADDCIHFKNKADFEEVKHGEWLMCLTDEPWRKGYHGRCSECGAEFQSKKKTAKFCEECRHKRSLQASARRQKRLREARKKVQTNADKQ